jgi:hypothetical protein
MYNQSSTVTTHGTRAVGELASSAAPGVEEHVGGLLQPLPCKDLDRLPGSGPCIVLTMAEERGGPRDLCLREWLRDSLIVAVRPPAPVRMSAAVCRVSARVGPSTHPPPGIRA